MPGPAACGPLQAATAVSLLSTVLQATVSCCRAGATWCLTEAFWWANQAADTISAFGAVLHAIRADKPSHSLALMAMMPSFAAVSSYCDMGSTDQVHRTGGGGEMPSSQLRRTAPGDLASTTAVALPKAHVV